MNTNAGREALDDIRRNLELVVEFTKSMDRIEFEGDYKSQYAVIRALEIVGEATKRIPQEARDGNPAIPWKAMAGMRDRLIHSYDNINVEIVWNTARDTAPKVLSRITDLIRSSNSDQSQTKD